jgi:hypothetical protein
MIRALSELAFASITGGGRHGEHTNESYSERFLKCVYVVDEQCVIVILGV